MNDDFENDDFEPDVSHGIVSHMNEDHADAVLAIARVHGQVPEATSARMLAITAECLNIETEAAGLTRQATITFDPPIDPLDTVRARLVAMTRSARAALAESRE